MPGCGDIFRAQEGIAEDTGAQFFAELAALLDIGFGHEDDELVAAVTGNYVEAPAILPRGCGRRA